MKELKAKEGYYLTQSADVAIEERTYIKAIKGMRVNEADWRDATIAEKEAHEAEMEKRRKEEQEQEQKQHTNN